MSSRADDSFLQYSFKSLGFMRFPEPIFAGICQDILTGPHFHFSVFSLFSVYHRETGVRADQLCEAGRPDPETFLAPCHGGIFNEPQSHRPQ